jgi:hypothetical protein
MGSGSVAALQAKSYQTSLGAMSAHTICAGLALLLGPWQFASFVRQRWIKIHRWIGRVYLASVLVAMIGTIAYLVRTPGQAIYTGIPFQWGLWGLCLLTLVSAALALHAIRSRDVMTHQIWMAFNFCMLLTAPGLRLVWILAGNLWRGIAQDMTNLAATTALLPFCILLAVLWTSGRRPQANARFTAVPSAGRRARFLVLAALSAATALWLCAGHRQELAAAGVGGLALLHLLMAGDLGPAGWLSLAGFVLALVTGPAVLSRRSKPDSLGMGRLDQLYLVALATGVLGMGMAAVALYPRANGSADAVALASLSTAAVLWLFTGAFALRELSSARAREAREWLIHSYAVTALPMTTLVVWLTARAAGEMQEDAVLIAAVLACPLNQFLSYCIVTVHRQAAQGLPRPIPQRP